MENTEIKRIGICIGCNKRAVIVDEICQECRENPSRGLRWAKLAGRIRNNPDLAMLVYSKIKSKESRRVFLFLFQDSMEKMGIDLEFIRAQVESA